jgi:hypothetical protein
MNLQQLSWTLSLLDNESSHIHKPEFRHMKDKMIQTVQNSFPDEVFNPLVPIMNIPEQKLMS